MALPGGKESLPATLRKENKEITLDYTINVMESDEFLHLLSEEESPEEQLKALHHCLEKLPEEQRTSITRFFLRGNVVCRHCGTDRIYSEQCEKLYPKRKAKLENLY